MGISMSIKERNLLRINKAILLSHQQEKEAKGKVERAIAWSRMAFSMLHFEFVKNDVAIRAQSLSYFTLFSILPLIAGIFLVLGFFSQWGPVQKEFEELLAGMLSSIPLEQRTSLLSYILQFKDQYLQNLSHKSGTIGVFAILVLFWIGARVFFNVESLMNRIWSVRAERALLDRLKNFIVSMVFLPFAYALVISLPKIIEHYGNRTVSVFLDEGLLAVLSLLSLFTVLKGFPHTRVSWKSALLGALAGTAGYGLANSILRIYFKFGTDTAYGKAGVLPVFAFFIYVAWLIFIFSVEVSLLVEHGGRMLERKLPQTTLGSALVMEKTVWILSGQFHQNSGPLSLETLSGKLELGPGVLEPVLDFLERKGWVIRVVSEGKSGADRYLIAHEVKEDELLGLLKEYLHLDRISQNFDVYGLVAKLNGN